MTDSDLDAIKNKERVQMLEQQIEDMLISLDFWQLVKELDHECQYSSQTKVEIVQILCKIKERQPDNKKLQKLISHYAVEHENVLALKP